MDICLPNGVIGSKGVKYWHNFHSFPGKKKRMRRSTAGTELRLTVLPARYIDTVITLTVVI